MNLNPRNSKNHHEKKEKKSKWIFNNDTLKEKISKDDYIYSCTFKKILQCMYPRIRQDLYFPSDFDVDLKT